jgi:hypothetical protein
MFDAKRGIIIFLEGRGDSSELCAAAKLVSKRRKHAPLSRATIDISRNAP